MHYVTRLRLRMEHNAARRLVYIAFQNAVRTGMLKRPETCSDCGGQGKVDGHHEDYSKPLNVVWLCTKCHGRRHSGGRVWTMPGSRRSSIAAARREKAGFDGYAASSPAAG